MTQLKKEYRSLEGEQIADICVNIASDGKGEDIVVLDVRKISSFADYFVILSGRSTRHVQALAVIVHIFYHEQRDFYDLEGLWHDAPRLETQS